MKKLQKRMLVQLLFGFLIGRVVLLERNPAGAAFFAAGLVQGGGVLPLLASVGLGMLSALSLEAVLRYSVAMVGVIFAQRLMRKQKIKMNIWQSSGLMAATLAILSVTQYTILPWQWKDILFTVLEPVLVVALARVFAEGQRYLLHYRRGRQACQEEVLSLILIGMLAMYGIPEMMISDISLTELAVFLIIPFAGYQYGIGIGAVAGAAGGILLTMTGTDVGIIGSLCLLGMAAAVFRDKGKMWSLLTI